MYQISSPPIIEVHKDGHTMGGIYCSPNQHYETQFSGGLFYRSREVNKMNENKPINHEELIEEITEAVLPLLHGVSVLKIEGYLKEVAVNIMKSTIVQ